MFNKKKYKYCAYLKEIDIMVYSLHNYHLYNLCYLFLGFFIFPSIQAYNAHYLICPGFATSSNDYYFMKQCIENNGHSSSILDVNRDEWIKNTPLIPKKKIISQRCTPTDLYGWYLDKLEENVIDIISNSNIEKKIILVGHSAGGWLARDFLGNGIFYHEYKPYYVKDYIAGLITLGTPHRKLRGMDNDLAFGCLDYVNRRYPECFLNDNLFYKTVCGNLNPSYLLKIEQEQLHFVLNRLKMFYKSCELDGDGVVPVQCAHLKGAEQINLNNVHHMFETPFCHWYGSKDIVDEWI